jgi:hypothetical protein
MPQAKSAWRRFYRRRWVILSVTLVAFLLLCLAVLPYGISYGLHKLLLDYGGEEVAIEDIDFNIFTGKAAIENLQVSDGDRPLLAIPRLDLDVDWLPLFSRRVLIRAVSLEGLQLVIAVTEDGVLRVGGVTIPDAREAPAAEPAGEVWGVGLESLRIANSGIRYSSPGLQIDTRVDEVSLSGLRTWATDPAPLAFTGALNGAATRLEGRLPPLSSGVGYQGRLAIDALDLAAFARLATAVSGLEGRLSVDTGVDVLLSGDQALSAVQDGMVRLAGLGLEQEGARVEYANLRWDGTARLSQRPGADMPEAGLQGRLAGEGLAVAAPADGPVIRQARLLWDGTTEIGPLQETPGMQVAVSSRLEGEGFDMVFPDQGLDVSQESFRWDGELVIDSGEATAIKANGSLRLTATDAEAEAGGEKIRLARIEGIELGNLVFAGPGDIRLSDLVLRGAVFARDAGAGAETAAAGSILSADSISADTLRVTDGSRIAIGTLEWRDVLSTVVREPDGQWRPVRILDTLPFTGAGEQAPVAEPRGTAAGALRVERIVVTGKSGMVFEDHSVQPPFRIRQYISRAVLSDVDTARPEQRSRLLLRSSFGRHSRFDVDGTIQPFKAPPAVDLQVALEGVALTPLSPYTVSTLGYSLKSGQLDADSTLRIDAGRLYGDNKLTIRALEVEAADNASQEELEAQLAVPLDTALGMLRDDNDTIRLDLPISGDFDNPDFDISGVINTAVGKALKQGSLTYLTLALQPYGALISVARIAGEAASRVRLQPVGFEPGGMDATSGVGDYLEKVAGIMRDRPDINIRVCGRVVAEDRRALAGTKEPVDAAAAAKEGAPAGEAGEAGTVSDEQLLALARERADFVKDKLVTEQSVSAARLVDCQPQIEKEGAPRVDLLI